MSALARLSFWVPAARMDEFETACAKKLAPILKKHDLIQATKPGRAAVEGIFSRLFELPSPAEIAARERALHRDAAWWEVLRDLGRIFGTTFAATHPDSVTPDYRGYYTADMIARMAPLLRYHLDPYTAPAGAGRAVEAGMGFRQGAWHNFSVPDGLPDSVVQQILEDREGRLWFATRGAGVCRYDGVEFITFTEEHGLAHNWVICMVEDQQGRLWFGTTESGVCCYDGVEFATFTEEHGLAQNWVMCAARDRQGCLWFGTRSGGASRYDGHQFTTFTTEDGLADNMVNHILTDQKGHVWFATDGGGVSRYDGRQFATFTTRDGLAHNRVRYIMQDRDGHLWFGTRGGGANIYDGLVFQKLTRQDGLAHDGVKQILQDGRGNFLLATLGGLTRYRPQGIPPTLRLKDVIADRRYGPVAEIQLPAVQHLLTFEFQGVSWTTRPDGMAYVYRLEGYDAEWQTTRARRVAYADLALGEYTFQVKAVDRDLNYSEPATVRVSVRPDPRIAALNEALSAAGASSEFVGKSPALLRFQEQMAEVAPTEVTVLVSGETGTGKGLGARIIHGLSPRKGGPFIQVNCGAIPENLVESELFGHERGAFTGAIARKLGKVELADGGTLFLDEIGDLPLAAQVKLLQLVDERTFERVGGTETLKPDVRIVAATNRDLQQMVHAGQFRGDLYFRLQVFPVRLPPLRQRRDDIPLLALYFMERMAAHLHKGVTHLAPESLSALQAYDWPGNVRELEHAVQRAVIVCRGAAIQTRDISLGSAVQDSVEEFVTLEAYERRYISRVLEQTGWVIGGEQGAAAILGLNESTLRGRLRKLGIERPNNRG